MQVENMTGRTGKAVPNQFVMNISGPNNWADGTMTGSGKLFQSYDSNIVFIEYTGKVYLDRDKWDYSGTTSKYRNKFLCETTKDTELKIKSGEYQLIDLNGKR